MADCEVALLVFHGATGGRLILLKWVGRAVGGALLAAPARLRLGAEHASPQRLACLPTPCPLAPRAPHPSAGALTQYSSAPMGGLLQRFAAACTRPHETYTNEDVSRPARLPPLPVLPPACCAAVRLAAGARRLHTLCTEQGALAPHPAAAPRPAHFLHSAATRPQLYCHHVLAQMAGAADEEDGTHARPARTLPSFWAAKAALERQRQRQAAAAAARRRTSAEGDGDEEGGGRPGKRQRTDEAEASLGRGEAAEDAEVSSFR